MPGTMPDSRTRLNRRSVTPRSVTGSPIHCNTSATDDSVSNIHSTIVTNRYRAKSMSLHEAGVRRFLFFALVSGGGCFFLLPCSPSLRGVFRGSVQARRGGVGGVGGGGSGVGGFFCWGVGRWGGFVRAGGWAPVAG